MSRICVCITGQLRQSDEGLRRLKSVMAAHDATFVFSVWDTIGSKIDGALNIDQVPRIFEPDAGDALPHRWLGYKNLWQALPALYEKRVRSFEHQSADSIRARITAIFPEAIVDVEASNLLCLEFVHPGEDKNSLRMLYKFWRANEIKRNLERSSGRFDYVLRMRPDLMVNAFDGDYIARYAEQHTVLVDAYVPGGAFVYDNFAAGNSAAIDAYCSLFGRALAIPQKWDHIHQALHHHLEDAGLRYELYPHLGGLAQDKRISAREVAESLDLMRHMGGRLGGAQAITLAAMTVASALTEGDTAAAVRMLGEPLDIGDAEVVDLDGYLAAAGKVFRHVDDPVLASACLCVSMHLRQAVPDRWPTWAVEIVVEAIVRCGRFEPTCDVASLSHSVVATLDVTRLPSYETLRSALGPLSDVILTQIRGLMSHAEFQTRLIDALAARDVYDAAFSLVETFTGDAASKHRLVLALKQGRAERAGNLDEAALYTEELLAQAPDDLQLVYKIADLQKDLGRFDDAERWQARAIALNPMHAGAFRQMSEICLHLGKIDQASDFNDRAFQLEESSYDAAVLRAYIAYRRAPLGAAASTKRPPEAYVPRPSFGRLPEFGQFYAGYAELTLKA